MKSVMSHKFSQIPSVDVPRSSFDRSHGHKTTFDAGWLVPVYADEALPGDSFNMNMTAFVRLASMIHVPMDNLYLDSFFFAIPYRLVWNNFPKFMGEQDDPGDSTDYTIPQVTAPAGGGVVAGHLYDYFGIPTAVNSLVFNNLFGRAYNLAFNQWFRDQNLVDSVAVPKDDGPDTYTDFVLLRRGKRHDYFTSALPWPQKSDSEVLLPLGTTADILTSSSRLVTGAQNKMTLHTHVAGSAIGSDVTLGAQATSSEVRLIGNSPTLLSDGVYPSNLYADLANASAPTINAIREAFQLQKMYERDARSGTRYTEVVKAHFGVDSKDARLQRVEYLGGGSTPITIHSVPQTSESNTTKQANLSSYGIGSFSGHGFTKSFTEHCLILGIINCRADLTYQQGLNRMWSRQTRADHYFPSLAHLGEQEILNKEIYADGSANDDLVFAYQERWSEYRYKPSMITGQFRSNHGTSLDAWHLSQEFGSLPTLDATFIEENPPVDRIIAVPTEPHFLGDFFFSLNCTRPMPLYSVPGFVDHF